MRSDPKKWYQQHVGRFTALHLLETEDISGYELGLIQLPDVDYNTYKSTVTLLFTESHSELRTILETIVSRITN